METFIVILLVFLSLIAAWFSVDFKRQKKHRSKNLPEAVPPWWKRIWNIFGYEALFRAFYLHLAFGGAALAAVTEGYKHESPYDFWMIPTFPLLCCVVVGICSQVFLHDDIDDNPSLRRIALIVVFGILASGSFAHAAWLSIHYWQPHHVSSNPASPS